MQYFLWYLCLLPLILPFSRLRLGDAVIMATFWFFGQVHTCTCTLTFTYINSALRVHNIMERMKIGHISWPISEVHVAS